MNITNGMRPVHPGEILSEEVDELGMTAAALADALDISTDTILTVL